MTTLQGKYLQVDKRGWKDLGHQSVKFQNSIKELPVYSRCNVLLKDQKQDKEEQERENQDDIKKEFHCSSLTLPTKDNQAKKVNSSFTQKVQLLKNSIKQDNRSEKSENLTVTNHNSHVNIVKNDKKNPLKGSFGTLTAVRGQNNKINSEISIHQSESGVTSPNSRQSQLLKQLQKQRLLRLSLERDYNNLLKQALKNKYGYQDQEVSERQENMKGSGFGSPKNKAYGSETGRKTVHINQQLTQRYSYKPLSPIDDVPAKNPIKTEVREYKYHPNGYQIKNQTGSSSSSRLQEYSDDVEIESEGEQDYQPQFEEKSYPRNNTRQYAQDLEYEVNNPQYPQHKVKITSQNRMQEAYQHHFSKEILQQLETMNKKIIQVQNSYKMREEQFKRQILERDLANRQRQLLRVNEENSRLRNNQEAINRNIPSASENRNQNLPNRNILINGFVIFLLGLLFAKSMLC